MQFYFSLSCIFLSSTTEIAIGSSFKFEFKYRNYISIMISTLLFFVYARRSIRKFLCRFLLTSPSVYYQFNSYLSRLKKWITTLRIMTVNHCLKKIQHNDYNNGIIMMMRIIWSIQFKSKFWFWSIYVFHFYFEDKRDWWIANWKTKHLRLFHVHAECCELISNVIIFWFFSFVSLMLLEPMFHAFSVSWDIWRKLSIS